MEADEGLERLMFYEQQRMQCAAEYLKSPHDPENLTKWGSALVELANFQHGANSILMVQDAISKLEAALQIDPKRADTLWNLGNAHTCHGFLMPVGVEANDEFRKAAVRFQDAYVAKPTELYLKSLEVAQMAPTMHQQLHSSQGMFPGSSSSKAGTSNVKKDSRGTELAYDIMGWVVLAIGIVAWVSLANTKPLPK